MKCRLFKFLSTALFFLSVLQSTDLVYPAGCLRPMPVIEEKMLFQEGNFSVQKYYDAGLKMELVRMTDGDSGTSIRLMPGRGATIISFESLAGEVLYFDNESKQGGIPICAPFGGDLKDGEFIIGRETHNLRGLETGECRDIVKTRQKDGRTDFAHGFVRFDQCRYENAGCSDVKGVYSTYSWDSAQHPTLAERIGKLRLTVTYYLKGSKLSIKCVMKNYGDTKIDPKTIAGIWLHPWFDVGEDYLLQTSATEEHVLDGAFATGNTVSVSGTDHDFSEAKKVKRGTDTVLTGLIPSGDGQFVSTIVRQSPLGKISIRLTQNQKAQNLVVYASTKQKEQRTLCVEPATHAPNRPPVLGPGEEICMEASIEVVHVETHPLPTILEAAAV